MSKHQITKNNLLKHANVFKKFPDIIFEADSSNDIFEPVEVITLQQYYKDKAYEEAWDHITFDPKNNLELKVEEMANKICAQKFAQKKEFVEIYKERVIIGINAEKITDLEITKAMAYLVSIDDFTPGEIYEFGEEKNINYEFASKILPEYNINLQENPKRIS
jgi:hypothetical protein